MTDSVAKQKELFPFLEQWGPRFPGPVGQKFRNVQSWKVVSFMAYTKNLALFPYRPNDAMFSSTRLRWYVAAERMRSKRRSSAASWMGLMHHWDDL
jgi:hypothetical protein